jgi:AmmeMemoRadiSam system protein B
MSFKNLLYSLIFFLIIVLAGFFVVRSYQHKSKVAGVNTMSDGQKVRGLIISHHDLTREYIIRTLDKLSKNNDYSYIVVFGPNHFYPDETAFLTSTKVFDYQIDGKEVQLLIDNRNNIIQDESRVEKEHSFNIPASYLRDYYPDAKFIPLVIPQNFDSGDIADIALFLSRSLPENTLYVASVDFSHEKTVLEAEDKNRQSQAAIANFDFESIYLYQSDHVDSPASIGLLLNVMKNLGSTKWNLWFDTHGAFIEDNPLLQGTSYLFGVFTE